MIVTQYFNVCSTVFNILYGIGAMRLNELLHAIAAKQKYIQEYITPIFQINIILGY